MVMYLTRAKPKPRKRNYTTVSIPLALMSRIDQVLATEGYRNRSDFILESIRRRLDELKTPRVEALESH
jgi:metal-responsive CopG/Arc/MetJ family transcriptional regulator